MVATSHRCFIKLSLPLTLGARPSRFLTVILIGLLGLHQQKVMAWGKLKLVPSNSRWPRQSSTCGMPRRALVVVAVQVASSDFEWLPCACCCCAALCSLCLSLLHASTLMCLWGTRGMRKNGQLQPSLTNDCRWSFGGPAGAARQSACLLTSLANFSNGDDCRLDLGPREIDEEEGAK